MQSPIKGERKSRLKELLQIPFDLRTESDLSELSDFLCVTYI